MTFSSLLATTDLSPHAALAARRGARLARQLGARFDLLHVLEKSSLDQVQAFFGAGNPALAERLETDARDGLHELATTLADAQDETLAIGTHLRHGKIVEEIASFADANDSQLVLLGAHGSGFTRQLFLGTTAERLLRRLLRPLLVVRGTQDADYTRVLVAVDFSPRSRAALQYARTLAPAVDLSLMHVFDIPFESKLRYAEVEESVLDHQRGRARQLATQGLHDLAQEAGLDPQHGYHCVVAHGQPAARVLQTAQQLGADLIVLCKHGVSLTNEVLLGSVTRQVLAEASCDVLVVR
ncbi:MAG: universal stress protein [Candidatus Dactylopiibacterium sp.]|nr:universal stress protein [Candidatus Dactylopiibacterium sp.]